MAKGTISENLRVPRTLEVRSPAGHSTGDGGQDGSEAQWAQAVDDLTGLETLLGARGSGGRGLEGVPHAAQFHELNHSRRCALLEDYYQWTYGARQVLGCDALDDRGGIALLTAMGALLEKVDGLLGGQGGGVKGTISENLRV